MIRYKFADACRLREPDRRVELFNVLNVFALLLMFFAINSRFVLSAGVPIALPVFGGQEFSATAGVITVQSEKFMVFNGNIFSLDTLAQGIGKFLRKNFGENLGQAAILIRPDRSLPVDVLMKVCEIAKKSGYATVQIASAPPSAR
ncbi:MAG: biopolymer transporter ExbD [Puniceicoccales bacterium]|nr:biopolymer transporter ExbD [Puniceicoccales bacterium]